MEAHTFRPYVSLSPDGLGVEILDQSLLPGREEWLILREEGELCRAIETLQVRGAPAIGIFAAYALSVLARGLPQEGEEARLEALEGCRRRLEATRPTAVNLAWALGEMMDAARTHIRDPRPAWEEALADRARAIHAQDEAMCLAISRHGLSLLKPGQGLLTHCNAGELATSRYGTGLGPILLGQEEGYGFHVYSDETRPLLQGARLTAWELNRAGVDVTLICDNMAATVMARGLVQACLVGCDRVAANGDTANKIGTSAVAILAAHYKIPFYVLGPTTTVDLSCPDGSAIPIEERPGEEIGSLWYRTPMAPQGVKCFNPAFDVTPASLITGIITEAGVCRPPYTQSLRAAVAAGRGEGR